MHAYIHVQWVNGEVWANLYICIYTCMSIYIYAYIHVQWVNGEVWASLYIYIYIYITCSG